MELDYKKKGGINDDRKKRKLPFSLPKHPKKRKQDTGLFREYTLQWGLDRLDVIECFEHPGQKPGVGKVLEEQKQIYAALGVPPPGSL